MTGRLSNQSEIDAAVAAQREHQSISADELESRAVGLETKAMMATVMFGFGDRVAQESAAKASDLRRDAARLRAGLGLASLMEPK